MKRIVAAILLLCLSFTAAFASNYLITKKLTILSEKLITLSETSAEISSGELKKRTGEIIAEWENAEWIVHMFLNADSVSETEKNLAKLEELANKDLTDEFAVQCIDTYTQINSVCNSEKINKENIF